MAVCKVCNKEFVPGRGSTGVYCGNKCQGKETQKKIVEAWLRGEVPATKKGGQLRNAIKDWVKCRDRYACVLCGWAEVNPVSGRVPVEVDHVDGDHTNNVPDNLRTLCPNCHSLTPTWKNTGNKKEKPRGRGYRRKT